MKICIIFNLFLIELSSCIQESSINIEPGVSKELAINRKANISKVNYELNFQVPSNKHEPINGSIVITYKLKTTEEPVVLDFNVPRSYLKSISINGKENNSVSVENEHLIVPTETLEVGSNKVTIEFRAGDLSLNRNDDYLYTLFVPDRASTAFPCFDQPDIKARYKLSLSVPHEWTALANAPLENENVTGETKNLVYEWSDLMSTYLFSFVAGAFDVESINYEGFTMNMLHREDDSIKLERNAKEIFDLHYDALRWLESYTNVKYPFKKFDFALIPGFQYGGMEHVGAIQYRASRLLLDETATLNDKISRSMLIAHETAHMWFGNLVTMKWFDDVWMKEVFANFMASKITEPKFPSIDHDLNFLFAHYPPAYAVDRTTGANPIKQELSNLKNAGSLYGSIIYHKAPIVMKQLEMKIGDQPFKQAIRQYLDNYANRNASWEDLVEIFDIISEDDIVSWSNSWVNEAGMPFINLDVNAFERDRSYRIVQFDLSGNNRVWPQDFMLRMEYELGESNVWAHMEEDTYTIKSGPTAEVPRYIWLNSNGTGYGTFSYGVDYVRDEFLFNRARVNLPAIKSDLTRGVSYITLHEYILHEGLNPQLYLSFLGDYVKLEENKLILSYLLDNYRTIFWKFMPEKYRLDNQLAAESLLWNKLNAIQDAELKYLILKTYFSIASSESGIQRLWDLWNENDLPENISLSENDKITLAFEIAVKDPERSEEILQMQFDQLKNKDRKDMMKFIMPALSMDESVRDEFFNALFNPANREHESWVLRALRYLHHPLRHETSFKYLRPSLDILEELQKTGDIFFPKRWLDRTLWGYNSGESVQVLNAYLSDNKDLDPKLRLKVLQSADLVFKADRDISNYLSKE